MSPEGRIAPASGPAQDLQLVPAVQSPAVGVRASLDVAIVGCGLIGQKRVGTGSRGPGRAGSPAAGPCRIPWPCSGWTCSPIEVSGPG
jgi:hypothetical protein